MTLNWLESYNLLTLDKIDSTSAEAQRLARSSAEEDYVIISKEQSAGKATKGREWDSKPGNLYSSILISSKLGLERIPELSFLVANAVYDAITSLAISQEVELDIKLKWPNDVLINGKKTAGILLESIFVKDRHYVMIGIGVNLLHAPNHLNCPVTSLFDEGVHPGGAREFLNSLMTNFHRLYSGWLSDNNFAKTRSDWMGRAYNLNKVITIDDGLRRTSGVFKEISFDGSMVMQLASGQFCSLASGEIEL
ncbi:MAG: biotin--[acetyl-CoA-carboxylase] ligase [Rickettsiales bacterium]|nr:MAG: biotin--[acetyl-CoA-carboxylase] ligase [Rickettsiales bacterium]